VPGETRLTIRCAGQGRLLITQVNNLSYGKDGIQLTGQFEGLRLTAYQDQVGVWTIGYGHTGPDVYQGLTITQNDATSFMPCWKS